jgi:putative endopeptidase
LAISISFKETKMSVGRFAMAWSLLACALPIHAEPTHSTAADAAGEDPESQVITEPVVSIGVRPQDDFYSYVNAKWLAETAIPDDVPWISPYVVNFLKVNAELQKLIEKLGSTNPPRNSQAQRIGDLYQSFMNESVIERLGVTPLAEDLRLIEQLQSRKQLPDILGFFNRTHYETLDVDSRGTTPIWAAVINDDRDAARMIVALQQAGLGLRGRDEYLSSDPAQIDLRRQYREQIVLVLNLAGSPEPGRQADAVLALETKFAEAQLSPEALSHPADLYHKARVADLRQSGPGFDWQRFLTSSGLGRPKAILVNAPSYLAAIAKLARDEPLATWRSYLRWQLLRRYSPYLSRSFAGADFAFFSGAELGNTKMQDRQTRGAQLVQFQLPMSLGKLYVETYLPAGSKERVEEIAENIRLVFADDIRNADWMAPATKQEALGKLEQVLIKIGYPKRWEQLPVDIRPDDLIGNLRRIAQLRTAADAQRLHRPVDRERWLEAPHSVNDYYNTTTNEVAVGAGSLQWPWFDLNADDASNYAGIGSSIGHELGHGFDDRGSLYDGIGNLREWWTPNDRAQFEVRARKLAAQYDAYEPLPGHKVSGALTESEDIGDLTGLTLAYRAFRHAHPMGQPASSEDLATDRRFFEAFCTHWRAKYRDQLLLRVLASNGHPPQQYRCNGPLSNFPPFQAAFDVKPGDAMYRAPQDMVAIW